MFMMVNIFKLNYFEYYHINKLFNINNNKLIYLTKQYLYHTQIIFNLNTSLSNISLETHLVNNNNLFIFTINYYNDSRISGICN